MPAMVVIPGSGQSGRRVLTDHVHSVLCNRICDGEEEYLVRWVCEAQMLNPPLSWHSLTELVQCLEPVQDYLETRARSIGIASQLQIDSRKRKYPEPEQDIDRRLSLSDRRKEDGQQGSASTLASPSPSPSPSAHSSSPHVFNGILETDTNGFVFCRSRSAPDIPVMALESITSPEMTRNAHKAKVDTALILIRNAYVKRLARVPGKAIHLINLVDATTPSLRFRYIADCVLDENQGVYRASSETQQGCLQCSPQMGRNIGCEYTQKCDCLEYAAVDESRITDPITKSEYEAAILNGTSTMGFPKKFPYFAEGTKREKTGCLVPFYLNSRHPIYECNDNCNCGPSCRNKNVQFGRQVELEIFRTDSGRGWGLKCKEDLHKGQFIDTYRGEIITDAEATRREMTSTKAKASYLYSLDKFAESENIKIEDIFVMDGEFMGGPTKFMNHSCEPNCRQYTVSYNRHDPRIYDIAFFACRFIQAGEELTFDYLDKDDDEPLERLGEDAVPCLCGTAKCRKWLWT